jgi:hypothetical protein
VVPTRDPYAVLGIEPGASQDTIKAAWRRLARVHHPDLTGEPAAARRATRQMAEINAAYQLLIKGRAPRGVAGRGAWGGPGSTGPRARAGAASRDAGDGYAAGSSRDTDGAGRASRASRGGPPRPRPTRPVTGRVDTTATFRPRNQTTTTPGASHPRPGWPPLRVERIPREPLRASDPTGPLHRGRVRGFRPPKPPPLAEAVTLALTFGKFRGHTLGEVAAFEPSYIDWIAGTIARDPELVAAARVIRDDLDARGVVRRRHMPAAGPSNVADAG